MFPTINKRETGVNLRKIMDERGLAAKDVQEYLGLGCVQSVYRWIDGVNMPTIDNLYERDLLVKKIADKIAKASFVDTIKSNEEKVYAKRITKENYAKEAESAYQQIMDLIDRFQKIDAAIVASNAQTKITTSYGTFTVAGAISLRSRLRGLGAYEDEADFEGNLQDKMQAEYNERVRFCANNNSQLQLTAENMH